MEAHTFAEDKAKFDAAGATIIGVSADSIARLDAFSSDPNYCAGKFPVASDPDHKIATSYDLTAASGKPGMKDVRGAEIGHDFIERVTFVIGKERQDRRHAFQQGRQDLARSACGTGLSDRAEAPLQIGRGSTPLIEKVAVFVGKVRLGRRNVKGDT